MIIWVRTHLGCATHFTMFTTSRTPRPRQTAHPQPPSPSRHASPASPPPARPITPYPSRLLPAPPTCLPYARSHLRRSCPATYSATPPPANHPTVPALRFSQLWPRPCSAPPAIRLMSPPTGSLHDGERRTRLPTATSPRPRCHSPVHYAHPPLSAPDTPPRNIDDIYRTALSLSSTI